MQKTIKKRDGRRVKFNSEKITKAIEKAGLATDELNQLRSEERRVGKECRSRWSPYH